jgi:Prophage antirepressor
MINTVQIYDKLTNKDREMEKRIETLLAPSGAGIRWQMVGDEPVFVAKDVCNALHISNSRDAVSRLEDDEKIKIMAGTKGVGSTDTSFNNQEMTAVNESGLYNLIFQSRKPEAKKFRKWVTGVVLPSIRKTGEFRISNVGHKIRGRASIDVTELLWTIDSMLNVGDKKEIAMECGVSVQTVSYVIGGKFRSPRVLMALYNRALDNSTSLYNNPGAAVEKLING